MNKGQAISFWKKQLKAATDCRTVAEQNLHLAARIESEATSALEALGANPGPALKGDALSPEQHLALTASLTTKRKPIQPQKKKPT